MKMKLKATIVVAFEVDTANYPPHYALEDIITFECNCLEDNPAELFEFVGADSVKIKVEGIDENS